MYRIFGRCARSCGMVGMAITSQCRAEQEVLGDLLNHVHPARLTRIHREHSDDLARELRSDLLELSEDLVLGDLRALQGRSDSLVLLGLLPGLRNLADPLAQDSGHRDHPDAMAERGHVEYV